MESITKQHVIRLNQELIGLVNAGISVSVFESNPLHRKSRRHGSSQTSLRFFYDLNQYLETATLSDESIELAIRERFPEALNYHKALAIFFCNGSGALAFEQLRFPSRTQAKVSRHLSAALVYPAALLILVFLGLLFTCSFTIPTIVDLYEQVDKAPPVSVALLARVQELLPIWAIMTPILILCVWIWWRQIGKNHAWRFFPGNHSYYQATANEHSSRVLSAMIQQGCEETVAVSLATPGSKSLKPGNRDENRSGDSLPPLIHWAIDVSKSSKQPLQELLPVVSDVYKISAHRQIKSWHSILPSIAGICVGGIFVFAYSYSLFAPVIDMLSDLAKPLNGLLRE